MSRARLAAARRTHRAACVASATGRHRSCGQRHAQVCRRRHPIRVMVAVSDTSRTRTADVSHRSATAGARPQPAPPGRVPTDNGRRAHQTACGCQRLTTRSTPGSRSGRPFARPLVVATPHFGPRGLPAPPPTHQPRGLQRPCGPFSNRTRWTPTPLSTMHLRTLRFACRMRPARR